MKGKTVVDNLLLKKSLTKKIQNLCTCVDVIMQRLCKEKNVQSVKCIINSATVLIKVMLKSYKESSHDVSIFYYETKFYNLVKTLKSFSKYKLNAILFKTLLNLI